MPARSASPDPDVSHRKLQHTTVESMLSIIRFVRKFLVLLAAGAGMMVFGRNSAEAQLTIQLPSRSVFGVNTVVKVPDSGSIYLGGNRRLSMGRNSRGIPLLPQSPLTANRGSGYESIGGGAFAHVQIISLKEMEADLMQGYSPAPAITSSTVRIEPPAAVRRKADFISRNLGGTKKR